MNRLAVLIPTIEGREWYLERLMNILQPQIDKHKYNAEVIILKDNKEMTIGAKRNLLTRIAIDNGFSHRSFIDDDDTVTDNYLSLNLPGMMQGYDCNSLVGIYSVNGIVNPVKHIFTHTLKYDPWYETETEYRRNPNHLTVCSLAKIGHIKFQEKNFGEDGCWSEDIAKEGCLKTEYEITEPFYNYLFRTKTDGI